MNMNRLYFLLVIVSILIIIPYRVNAFFRVSPSSINVTRNINCRVNGNQTSASDFQLCAIRVYQGMINSTAQTFSLYNGFHYGNTLRRYIQKACSTEGNVLPTDTGIWGCTFPLPFEISVSIISICVCAIDNCNIDLDTCQQSVRSNSDILPLLDVMPDLNVILQCSDTLNANNTCGENPFINITLCQAYVRNNSVLCAVTVNGTVITQTSLIYENYEAYLDEKIYEVRSALSMASNNFSLESNNTVFYNFSTSATGGSVEECACTSYSFCNEQIMTCALSTIVTSSETETTTIPLSSSITVYSSAVIDTTEPPTTMIAISTGTTSAAMSTSATSTVMSTESIMTTMSPESTITTMSPESVITTISPEATMTTMSPESIVTTMSTGPTMTTIPTEPITIFTTMESIITTQSTSSSVITVGTTITTSTATQSKYCSLFS